MQTREDTLDLCNSLLDLRNRVAHHEPIYRLSLTDLRQKLSRVFGAMYAVSDRYAALKLKVSNETEGVPSAGSHDRVRYVG
jgi:hypothetical protein